MWLEDQAKPARGGVRVNVRTKNSANARAALARPIDFRKGSERGSHASVATAAVRSCIAGFLLEIAAPAKTQAPIMASINVTTNWHRKETSSQQVLRFKKLRGQ